MKNHCDTPLVWVDLDNSPHVPFFKPIIQELRNRGYPVVVTARDCFQVCGLAKLLDVDCKAVGRHYGSNSLMKITGTVFRAVNLLPFVLRSRPRMALSHGSRAQLLLAKTLSIPSVLMFDYEHARSLQVFGPTWSMAPDVIYEQSPLLSDLQNVLTYPGIKEDVYVPHFKPGPSIRDMFHIDTNELLVTIRPPATEAHYHNPESETLFEAVIERLGSIDNARMLLLPRNQRQDASIRARWPELCKSGKMFIPEEVLDGLNLIWYSDLVVSGGGTMNREAAALAVPVYSTFRGKIGAVDRYLAKTDRLVLLESVSDVHSKLEIKKRNIGPDALQGNGKALSTIVDAVVRIVEGSSN